MGSADAAIATSLTGPVAYAVGLIGIAIAGGSMLWGGELTEFGRRACMIGLVVSCTGVRRADAVVGVRRVRCGGVVMQDADRPREVIIHQSANRPNQIMGGDRELVLVTILITVALAFSLASVWGVALAGAWHGSAMAAAETDGKGGSAAAAGVYAAHTISALLPGEKRPVLPCLQPPMKWL